jgi:hypothetical protein
MAVLAVALSALVATVQHEALPHREAAPLPEQTAGSKKRRAGSGSAASAAPPADWPPLVSVPAELLEGGAPMALELACPPEPSAARLAAVAEWAVGEEQLPELRGRPLVSPWADAIARALLRSPALVALLPDLFPAMRAGRADALLAEPDAALDEGARAATAHLLGAAAAAWESLVVQGPGASFSATLQALQGTLGKLQTSGKPTAVHQALSELLEDLVVADPAQ